ncbi:hypothetical protein TrCOL_g11680 [Triparma columacea]|uniref:Uncharacterized protein n=1 Tax=Triparma columacea TaxID=722753 RepID=A0A9W7GF26_9STRA|nr:hypothetical protein TrCOL_g11680 [Triparma columacea]
MPPTTPTPTDTPLPSWFLFTGQPNSGKTTSVLTTISHLLPLLPPSTYLTGFTTSEVLSSSSTRIGFDVVTIPQNDRGILSRKSGPSHHPKTGAYSVDVEAFEKLALPTITLPVDGYVVKRDGSKVKKEDVVYVIDEVGRMELHSEVFRNRVNDLLSLGVRLIGAITAPIYGHRVPFCDDLVERGAKSIRVFRIKKSDRDEVTEEVIQLIADTWGGGKKRKRES